MMDAGMAYGPTNEMGVVYLFGMVPWDLGFVVMRNPGAVSRLRGDAEDRRPTLAAGED